MIVLDTSATIDFLKGDKEVVDSIESTQKSSGPLAITTITLFELLHPIYHRKLERHERIIRAFSRQIPVLGLDFAAAEESARLMGSLLRIGRPVNALDVLVAGIAVSNGVHGLITRDKDFEDISKVTGLRILVV